MSAIELDVYSLAVGGSSDPPTFLATLTTAFDVSVRIEKTGVGSGQFRMTRTDAQASAAIIAQGHLVKVRVPAVSTDPIAGFFLETGDFVLLSSEEQGGEVLTFGGRGPLAYLERAIMWHHSYVGSDPFDGLWRLYAAGGGAAPGQLLMRVIDEATAVSRPQHEIPLVAVDFDYTNDSDGNAWTTTDATDEFTAAIGEDVLSVVLRLIGTGSLTVIMDPDFALHGYNSYGRDLTGDAFGTGVVRLVKGANIAQEVVREIPADQSATHILVGGEDDTYGTSTLPDAASRVTRSIYLSAYGSGTTALAGQGLAELQRRLDRGEHVLIPIVTGDSEATGRYLPGPPGSNGHVWIGDTIRVHTGTGNQDFDEQDMEVAALVISTSVADDLECIVEIGPTSPTPGMGPGADIHHPPAPDTTEIPDLELVLGEANAMIEVYRCITGWYMEDWEGAAANWFAGSWNSDNVGWLPAGCDIGLGGFQHPIQWHLLFTFDVPADADFVGLAGMVEWSETGDPAGYGHEGFGYLDSPYTHQTGYQVGVGPCADPPTGFMSIITSFAPAGGIAGWATSGQYVYIPPHAAAWGSTLGLLITPTFMASDDGNERRMVCDWAICADGCGSIEVHSDPTPSVYTLSLPEGERGWVTLGPAGTFDGFDRTFTLIGGYEQVAWVTVNGLQLGATEWSATDGSTITFARAPLPTDLVLVRYLVPGTVGS